MKASVLRAHDVTLDSLGLVGVTQTEFGRGPDFNEPPGNCMQAALATVLGVPLDVVPHFLKAWDRDNWWDAMQAWLLERFGIAIVGLSAGGWTPSPVLHLMVGPTERGSQHVVVAFGGELLHDPHPSRAGLLKAEVYEFFVARTPVGKAART